MGVREIPWEETDGTEPGPLGAVRLQSGSIAVHLAGTPDHPWRIITSGPGIGLTFSWPAIRDDVTHLIVRQVGDGRPVLAGVFREGEVCTCGLPNNHTMKVHDARITERAEQAAGVADAEVRKANDAAYGLDPVRAALDPYRLEAMSIAVHHHQMPRGIDTVTDGDLIATAAAVERYLRSGAYAGPRAQLPAEFEMYWREDGHHKDCDGTHDWSVPCHDTAGPGECLEEDGFGLVCRLAADHGDKWHSGVNPAGGAGSWTASDARR